MVRDSDPNYVSRKDAPRVLRREPTAAEERLWSVLRREQVNGLRFRRQKRFGAFIADFYCPAVRLVVEVDGTVHDAPDRQAYDRDRDAALSDMGLHILRVTNDEVFTDLWSVVGRIRSAAQAHDRSPVQHQQNDH